MRPDFILPGMGDIEGAARVAAATGQAAQKQGLDRLHREAGTLHDLAMQKSRQARADIATLVPPR